MSLSILFKNRFITIFFLFVAIFFFVSSEAFAADYYVSSIRSGRSDNNSGTDPNRPWATFQHIKDVWNNLQPGDTVHLERGSEWTWSNYDAFWYIKDGGGSETGGYVTVRGDDYGDASKSKPILKRVGNDTHGSGAINIETNYVIFRDFVIDGGHADRSNLHTSGFTIGDSSLGTDKHVHHVQILNMRLMNLGGGADGPGDKYVCGISLGGREGDNDSISDVLVEGNEISDFAAHGLRHYTPANAYNIIWRRNYVHNNYPERWQGSVGMPIAYSTGGYGNVFEYNILEDTTTQYAGIVLFNRYSKDDTSPAKIRYNIIRNNRGAGIFIEGANLQDPSRASSGQEIVLADIYGNIIYNNKQEGIRASNDPGASYGPTSKINIFNNIFYNNALDRNKEWGSPISEIEINKFDANFEIKNNIIVGTNNNSLLNIPSYRTLEHSNNLFWNTQGSSFNVKNGCKISDVKSCFESSAVNSDPLFVNVGSLITSINSSGPNSNGFSLQSSSPAINAGTTLIGIFAKAINGVVRSGSWDIGAYEYGGSTPSPEPSCSVDIWEYSAWSSCENNIQTRTATKTFDCPLVDTPSLPTTQTCTSPNATPELIGWYKLNENTGSIIRDSSSKGNMGAINGAVWSVGKEGSALSFNGDSDYAQIPTNGLSVSQGTVSLWGYVKDFGQKFYSGAFFMHNSDANWSNKIHIYPEDGKAKVGLGLTHELASVPMNLNEWYHLVLTWNNGGYAFYVNGEKKSSGNYSGLNTLNNFADIGNTGNPSSRSWALNGKVDDVKIYNYAISDSDVLFLYRSGTTTPSPSPSCSEDIWTFGPWNTCSTAGVQTRTATLSFDCIYVNSTPIVSQSCSPSPACSEDIWTLGAWSECSTQGIQTRTATQTFDCPNVYITPATTQSCTPPNQYQPNTFSLSLSFANGLVSQEPLKSSYNYGENVTLFARPNQGYSFSSWSGDWGGNSNPIIVNMDSNKTIGANFVSQLSSNTPSSPVSITFGQTPSSGTRRILTRNLYLGATNIEVITLQQILNKNPETALISKSGIGLPGKESNYFGSITEDAVKRFQKKYNIASPGVPGYGMVGPKTRAKLNQI